MMKYPIVIFEQECDLAMFNTVRDAERYLEPIDVKNDEYIGFDSEGRLLAIKVEQNKVRIEETAFIQKEILMGKLVDFLARVKNMQKIDLLKMPLADLIQLGR